MTVVSDTSPLNYLVWIGLADVLPRLFGRIIIPAAVHGELLAPSAPEPVRAVALRPPPWLSVRPAEVNSIAFDLHAGEVAAISLARLLRADLLLMDDHKAVEAARALGLNVVGTLGILVRGAQAGCVDAAVVERLQATNFRASSRLLQSVDERIRRAL